MKKNSLFFVALLAVLALMLAQASFAEQKHKKELPAKMQKAEANNGSGKATKICRREIIQAKKECLKMKGVERMECRMQVQELAKGCPDKMAMKKKKGNDKKMSDKSNSR